LADEVEEVTVDSKRKVSEVPQTYLQRQARKPRI